MKSFFSKRHQEALWAEKLKPSFSIPCRVSILRVLNQYSDWENYDSINVTFNLIEEDLKTFYGTHALKAFDDSGGRVSASSLDQVIERGLPYELLDIIEAWFYQSPKQAGLCEKELNDVFVVHNSPWRIINGEAILVDSEYLHREVRARSLELMKECEFLGALDEYQEAIDKLTACETKDAIVYAHKSIESVMKAVLKTKSHKYGELLDMLIKSKIIPDYYDEFLKHFEKLALGAVKERNLPARGHGQGKDVTQVPASLAEFAVNLAGSINVFILKHWKEANESSVDDFPFEPS